MNHLQQISVRMQGREMGHEFDDDIAEFAKQHGIVIATGYSDDGMEFRGAIESEVSCWDGCKAFINAEGIPENKCDDPDCPYHAAEKEKCKIVEAKWDEGGYSWFIDTEIPHVGFSICEDHELYCRGIAFYLKDAEAE